MNGINYKMIQDRVYHWLRVGVQGYEYCYQIMSSKKANHVSLIRNYIKIR